MKNLLVLTALLQMTICVLGQEQSKPIKTIITNYTHISDSSGYQTYYAIEILVNGKPTKSFREATIVKTTIDKEVVKGRWYFSNYSDQILIKPLNEDEKERIVNINNLATLAFKKKDNYEIILAGAILLGGMRPIGALAKSDWITFYISRKDTEARIVIKKETEKEKLKREKIEAKLNRKK